jgi:hypothetical protein
MNAFIKIALRPMIKNQKGSQASTLVSYLSAGNIRRGVPAGAEVVAVGARRVGIAVVEARGKVADVLGRLASDGSELREAANIGEHYCEEENSETTLNNRKTAKRT